MNEKSLYFDHDSADGQLLQALRRRGFDCLTSIAAEMERATDEEQLQFASGDGRVLVTANQGDFVRLHWQFVGGGRHHAGIVIADQRLSLSHRIQALASLFDQAPPLERRDQIWFLSSWPGG
ncbi:MAG: DUF5615 family PIN-like protein [Dehalococcoidia bacterium]